MFSILSPTTGMAVSTPKALIPHLEVANPLDENPSVSSYSLDPICQSERIYGLSNQEPALDVGWKISTPY